MDSELGYGPRLTDDDYERRIVALHCGLPAMPTWEQDRATRRAELELAIDHRLGRDFPQEKRDALWRILQRTERRRMLLVARRLVVQLFDRQGRHAAAAGRSLAASMVDQFAEVLSDRELKSFFRGGNGLGLPVDRDREGR